MTRNDPERSYGKFGVRAFAANSAYPVENALVIVRSKKSDGTPVTVAVLETDESGKTQVITLETPPKSLSLSPGSDIPPYSLYDVEITHPGFYSIITRDVQIYPDTTSILPINMLPLPDTGMRNNIIINEGFIAPDL
jgi:hypothetical protein